VTSRKCLAENAAEGPPEFAAPASSFSNRPRRLAKLPSVLLKPLMQVTSLQVGHELIPRPWTTRLDIMVHCSIASRVGGWDQIPLSTAAAILGNKDRRRIRISSKPPSYLVRAALDVFTGVRGVHSVLAKGSFVTTAGVRLHYGGYAFSALAAWRLTMMAAPASASALRDANPTAVERAGGK
jgi:hypothetical protein